jgi:hypothetical protein
MKDGISSARITRDAAAQFPYDPTPQFSLLLVVTPITFISPYILSIAAKYRLKPYRLKSNTG